MSRARLAAVTITLIGLAACSGEKTSSALPTAPTSISQPTTGTPPTTGPGSPVGKWSGSFRDPVFGEGNMQMSLDAPVAAPPSGTPDLLTGTWSASFPGGMTVAGAVQGALYQQRGYIASLFVAPEPRCDSSSSNAVTVLQAYLVADLAATSNQLTGTAIRMSCAGPLILGSTSTVSLTRQ